MNIPELIKLTEARVVFLEGNLIQVKQIGDVEQVMALESKLDETKSTLAALQTLG